MLGARDRRATQDCRAPGIPACKPLSASCRPPRGEPATLAPCPLPQPHGQGPGAVCRVGLGALPGYPAGEESECQSLRPPQEPPHSCPDAPPRLRLPHLLPSSPLLPSPSPLPPLPSPLPSPSPPSLPPPLPSPLPSPPPPPLPSPCSCYVQGRAGAAPAAISPAQPPVTGTFVSTLELIQETTPRVPDDSASPAHSTPASPSDPSPAGARAPASPDPSSSARPVGLPGMLCLRVLAWQAWGPG